MEVKWISVKERLPEPETPFHGYLVWIANRDPKYLHGGYPGIVRFSRDSKMFLLEDPTYRAFFDHVTSQVIITHWSEEQIQPPTNQ